MGRATTHSKWDIGVESFTSNKEVSALAGMPQPVCVTERHCSNVILLVRFVLVWFVSGVCGEFQPYDLCLLAFCKPLLVNDSCRLVELELFQCFW